jgi:hypothetical protein
MGDVFEQDQVVEGLPSARRRNLQSPSTAESPKQDYGETFRKHSEITASGQLALSQRLEGRRGCGDLASEASKEGLVSGRDGEF